MSLTIDQVKIALRVDDTDDDALLSGYLIAAQDYLCNFINCKTDDDYVANNKRYDICVLMLVGHWYSHRMAVSDASTNTSMVQTPLGVNSLAWQLKLDYQVAITTTTTLSTTAGDLDGSD